jgi:hypothetical protein
MHKRSVNTTIFKLFIFIIHYSHEVFIILRHNNDGVVGCIVTDKSGLCLGGNIFNYL